MKGIPPIGQLKSDQFTSVSDLQNKAANRFNTYNRDSTLGRDRASAKGILRWIDVIGTALDKAFQSLLGYFYSEGIKISSTTDGIYIVRSFSGSGWGADSDERGFLSQVPNGTSNDINAFAMNAVSIGLDLTSLIFKLDDLVDPICFTDVTEETIKSIIEQKLTFYSINDLIYFLPDVSYDIGWRLSSCVTKNASKNLFKFIAKTIKVSAEEAAKWLSQYKWVEIAAKSGKIIERGTKLYAYATPLESTFIIVGSPFVIDIDPPSVPTSLTATAFSATQINLTWNISTDNVGTIGYKIYRDGVQIGTSMTLSYSDTSLSPTTKYCYTVLAYDAAGNESGHSSPMCVITMSVLANKIIFLTTRDNNWEIYSLDWDGSNPTNLTNNSADDKLPALSPDRGRIAFVSDRDGNNEIYVMDSDGNNLRRLTNNYSDDFTPTWSPDGLKIAFVSKRDENYEIYVMNADGTGQTRLTNNYSDDLFPAWSPDGTKIVFVSKRDGDNEVYVMDSDGLNQNNLSWSYADDTIPFFSPDGSRIAFVSNRSGDYDLWTMDSNGFNHRKLTGDATDTVGWYAWSPDGTQIAFDSSMDGDSEIYIINSGGTNLRQLTNNTASDKFSSWTWDGTKIVFISDRDGNDEIYLMDPDGGNPLNLSNDPSDDDLPAASPVYQEGGGCFIATVAFGSYLDPHVLVLREFRDNYLLSNVPGRAFVAFYYKYSPPAAQFIRRHENLRTVIRWVLTPVVFGVKYPHILIAFVVIITGFSVYRRKQKTRRYS